MYQEIIHVCTQYIVQRNTHTFQVCGKDVTASDSNWRSQRSSFNCAGQQGHDKPAKAHATCPALGWKSFEGSSGSLELVHPVVNERRSWQGTQRSMTRLNMNIKEITHRVAHVLAGFLTPVFHPLPSGLWDGIRADILPFIGWWYKALCVCVGNGGGRQSYIECWRWVVAMRLADCPANFVSDRSLERE